MGGTPPPTPMKKQKARPPPPIFNLSPRLSCPSPRGGAWAPSGPWEGGHQGSLGGGVVASLFPISFHHLATRSELRTWGMERIWDLALRHPLPHRVPCYPRGGGQRGRAAREAGLGEGKGGKKGRPAEVPAPRPQRHLSSATYRGSSSSQGRGRSSSERSVRPTEPLKGAGANQRGSEESGGVAPVHRVPLNHPPQARGLRHFVFKAFLA